VAKIIQLFTIARRLFTPDTTPWSQLTAPSNLARLREKYKFAQMVQPDQLPGVPAQLQVIFANGEYQHDQELIGIQSLSVEPNVIQFQVSAGTQGADYFFADLTTFLQELRPEPKIEEYKKTYQTIAVTRLNVPFEEIFSTGFVKFLNNRVKPSLRLPDGEPHIRLASLSWLVTYRAESADTMYLPKQLTIEPRFGSKMDDQIYYTMSPTDSETHIGLLEDFERNLGNDRSSSHNATSKRLPGKRNVGAFQKRLK
jgi:hypothetical protein